ncbi:hypothetical protein [Flavobacterium branchiicola]|uniref:Uncharacterized protein n=1 Tax=Flavobacterium branchiicola TaxID=1114875 RepID=A0ABV9PJH7_9FLAO|nr:hypothetical protein [Flavobacterium branchiicola]MBS7256730.1 hypothetical protein [Flavobacterium branchiicola]
MKKKNIVVLVVFLIGQAAKSQGIVTSADNSVNAIFASSGTIPKADAGTATWSATNAYWAAPLIYRARRFPDNASGAFPFNNYGELMIQGTSHGVDYNKGISFLTWDGSGLSPEIRMRITPTGKIGIGTVNPSADLDIVSPAFVGAEALLELSISDASKDYLKIANGTLTSGQFIPTITGYHTSDNRAALYLTGTIDVTSDNGSNPITIFDARTMDAAVITRPLFGWDSYGARKMTLNSNGSLGIGTVTTGVHKLAVEGSIGAREIKVQATGWSDFVFKKEYNLPTLEQVEKHITEKGHLENIPSEEEVVKNGINLGEMNAKLLQKIEELTLYSIQQNKKIIEMEKRLKKVESKSK